MAPPRVVAEVCPADNGKVASPRVQRVGTRLSQHAVRETITRGCRSLFTDDPLHRARRRHVIFGTEQRMRTAEDNVEIRFPARCGRERPASGLPAGRRGLTQPPSARPSRPSSRASFRRASSCSHTLSTRQPIRRSVRLTNRSRARFAAIFLRQNAAYPPGLMKCRGHPCQKQLAAP